MVSLEEKEKNQKYISDHLEEYITDIHGNFVNVIDPDTYGTDYFCISKGGLTPEGHQKIKDKYFEKWLSEDKARKKFAETILREIENWELTYHTFNFYSVNDNLKGLRHKQSGREISADLCDFETYYKIVGELGYRKNIWEDYEKTIKSWEERDKQWEEYCQKNLTNI